MVRPSTARFLVLLAVLSMASAAVAQDEKPRERQVLDPESNQWVDQAATPESVGGDIEQARRWLAPNLGYEPD